MVIPRKVKDAVTGFILQIDRIVEIKLARGWKTGIYSIPYIFYSQIGNSRRIHLN